MCETAHSKRADVGLVANAPHPDTEPANGRVTLRPKYDYFAQDGLMAWERYAAYGERVRAKREQQEETR